MPTFAAVGALRTPVRPGPVHGTLAGETGHVVVTAALGPAPVRPESPATVGPIQTPTQPSIAFATQHLTARECGYGEEVDTTDGTRCRDFMPELMIELI